MTRRLVPILAILALAAGGCGSTQTSATHTDTIAPPTAAHIAELQRQEARETAEAKRSKAALAAKRKAHPTHAEEAVALIKSKCPKCNPPAHPTHAEEAAALLRSVGVKPATGRAAAAQEATARKETQEAEALVKETTTNGKENCVHPSEAEPCEGKALEEKKRREAESPQHEELEKANEQRGEEAKEQARQIEEYKAAKRAAEGG